MLINLSRLNESLEKKYFSESVTLEEKFSDMPNWLSKRILTTKYSRYDGQARDAQASRGMGIKGTKDRWGQTYISTDQIDKKNPGAGPKPSYINPKDYSEKSQDKSLYAQMLHKGINLDSVKVIEGPKPEKRTDSRLQEPNIPIFLFKNGQVYAKGVNDNEEYAGDPDYRAFKYLPIKTLLSDEVKAFAYIDGNDDENFQANVKQDKRTKIKTELNNIPNYDRDPSRAGKQVYKRGWKNVDKSGYIVIPSPEKYKDKLAELKCSKIYAVLDEKYQLLEETKEELSNILLNADIKDSSNDSDYRKAFEQNLFEAFKNASKYYRECVRYVDGIVNNPRFDEARKKEELIYFINYGSDYSYLMEYCKQIEQQAPSLFNSIIDWI